MSSFFLLCSFLDGFFYKKKIIKSWCSVKTRFPKPAGCTWNFKKYTHKRISTQVLIVTGFYLMVVSQVDILSGFLETIFWDLHSLSSKEVFWAQTSGPVSPMWRGHSVWLCWTGLSLAGRNKGAGEWIILAKSGSRLHGGCSWGKS